MRRQLSHLHICPRSVGTSGGLCRRSDEADNLIHVFVYVHGIIISRQRGVLWHTPFFFEIEKKVKNGKIVIRKICGLYRSLQSPW